MKLLLDLRAMLFIGVAVGGGLVFPTSAFPDVAGKARIVDGDTITVSEDRIRLHGIDAPEQRQTCLKENTEWACGAESTDALKRMIAGKTVHCIGDERDRYSRLIAVCFVGSLSLNKRMVSEGWALAYRRYSKDYIPEETDAQNAGRGMWRGEFLAPWDWRKKQRSQSR